MLHSPNSRHRTWLVTGLTGAILVGGAFAMAGTAAADDQQSSPPPAGIPNTSLTEAVDAALEDRGYECDATAALLDDSSETVWSIILECDDGAMHYVEVDAVTGDVKDDESPKPDATQDKDDKAGTDTSTDTGDKSTADKKSDDKGDKGDHDPNDASGTGANVDKSSDDAQDKKSHKDTGGAVAPARD